MEGSLTGKVRHRSVTTTFAVNVARQRTQASLSQFARPDSLRRPTASCGHHMSFRYQSPVPASGETIGGPPRCWRRLPRGQPLGKEVGERRHDPPAGDRLRKGTSLGYSMTRHKASRLKRAAPSLARLDRPLPVGRSERCLKELDGWLRRKLDYIVWRQWKRPATRATRLSDLTEQRHVTRPATVMNPGGTPGPAT